MLKVNDLVYVDLKDSGLYGRVLLIHKDLVIGYFSNNPFNAHVKKGAVIKSFERKQVKRMSGDLVPTGRRKPESPAELNKILGDIVAYSRKFPLGHPNKEILRQLIRRVHSAGMLNLNQL